MEPWGTPQVSWAEEDEAFRHTNEKASVFKARLKLLNCRAACSVSTHCSNLAMSNLWSIELSA